MEARVRYESVRGKENIEQEGVITRQNVSEKVALKRTRNSHKVWPLTVMILLDMISTSTLPDAVLIVLVLIIILYRLHKDILSESALPSGSSSEEKDSCVQFVPSPFLHYENWLAKTVYYQELRTEAAVLGDPPHYKGQKP